MHETARDGAPAVVFFLLFSPTHNSGLEIEEEDSCI